MEHSSKLNSIGLVPAPPRTYAVVVERAGVCRAYCVRALPVGTDREFSASFDHQASATLSFSFPCLFLPDARKTVFNLCLVPPKGYARMEPVPRFDRARNSEAKFST